jgi:hypothetical protein
MTETVDATKAELLERIEALERRVTALEDEKDVTHTPGERNGCDRRDRAVLEYVREHGETNPRQTVELFKRLTDVNREKTAQRRAKELRQTAAWEEAVQ